MLFPTLAIWLYFVVLADSAWVRLAYAAGKAVQFAFPLAWAIAVERAPVGWRWFGRAGLGPGLWTGAVALLGILVGFRALLAGGPAVAEAPTAIAAKMAAFGIETPLGFALLAAFYAVVHSLLEEYYWRWFVYGRLRRRLGVSAALVVASLAFASHHVVLIGLLRGSFDAATWMLASSVALAGALWAWLYERSGSLAGPWLSHALVDAALMWIGYGLWTAGR